MSFFPEKHNGVTTANDLPNEAREQMNATRIGTMLRVAAAFAAFLAPGASVAGEQATLKVF